MTVKVALSLDRGIKLLLMSFPTYCGKSRALLNFAADARDAFSGPHQLVILVQLTAVGPMAGFFC